MSPPRRLGPAGAVLLLLSLPGTALGRPGALALVNLGRAGWERAVEAQGHLKPLIGAWARDPGIAAYLAGRPNPGALPGGETGQELVRRVDSLRAAQRPAEEDLSALGRLLGVDYLLLLQVRARTVSARLYSVPRGRYAPRGFEADTGQLATVAAYVRDQAQGGAPAPRKSPTRWWIWAIAAGVGALTLGLALGLQGDDPSGELRIRASR